MCDDFSGYKASFAQGITEAGCLAHARRKFFDLHAANQSQLAQFALEQIGKVYEIERQAKELGTEDRLALRQKAQPADPERIARVDAAAKAKAARQLSHRQSAGLQPQALGRTHAIHDQRATPRGQQLDRESDPADCRWAK